MRQSAKEYIPAIFKWWWVIVMGFAGGIIGAVLTIQRGLDIPIWVWIAIAIVGLFIAQFLAFHKIRVTLERRVIKPSQIEEILTRLGDLREEGVGIRNEGEKLQSEIQVADWVKSAKNWRDTVISEISKLSPAEASIFRTEDLVEFRRPMPAISPEHISWLGILSQDTEKIRKLVHKFTPQNIAKKAGIEG